MIELDVGEILDTKDKRIIGYQLTIKGQVSGDTLDRCEDVILDDFLQLGRKFIQRRMALREASEGRRSNIIPIAAAMKPKDPEGAA